VGDETFVVYNSGFPVKPANHCADDMYFYRRMKFKNILSLKSLIVLGFVIAVIPLF